MGSIGASIAIRGDLTGNEALTIDGRVQGTIAVRGDLTISATAHVDAEISGAQITVLGSVRGNLSATTRIVLCASADVAGSLSANFIVIEEGARFNGRIDMARRTIAAKVAQHRTNEAADARAAERPSSRTGEAVR